MATGSKARGESDFGNCLLGRKKKALGFVDANGGEVIVKILAYDTSEQLGVIAIAEIDKGGGIGFGNVGKILVDVFDRALDQADIFNGDLRAWRHKSTLGTMIVSRDPQKDL